MDKKAERMIQAVIKEVCAEFQVSPKALFEGDASQENLLQLVMISLVSECCHFSPRTMKAWFEKNFDRKVCWTKSRLEKYLELIPGLRSKHERLKRRITKRVGGF